MARTLDLQLLCRGDGEKGWRMIGLVVGVKGLVVRVSGLVAGVKELVVGVRGCVSLTEL